MYVSRLQVDVPLQGCRLGHRFGMIFGTTLTFEITLRSAAGIGAGFFWAAQGWGNILGGKL